MSISSVSEILKMKIYIPLNLYVYNIVLFSDEPCSHKLHGDHYILHYHNIEIQIFI